jgi:multidrug resistance efflux pump
MNIKRKTALVSIFIALLITLAAVGFYYWYNNTYYVSSEDAKVAGDFVKVTPQISGKLLEFHVKEGDTVVKDQIIGRIEAVGMSAYNIDTSLLRAPVSGIVVKKQAMIGEYESSASEPTLALLVDPNQLYISANIEETKLEKIKPGQQVDVRIDQFDGQIFIGKIESVGRAANSAFSLLPSTSGDTFTKVIQKVPVKIKLENRDAVFLPGTNAVVKIHIK